MDNWEIEMRIIKIESRISSGIISNPRTLRYKQKELKVLKNKLCKKQ